MVFETREWRPIDEAPKDGTEILVLGSHALLGTFVEKAKWDVEKNCWEFKENPPESFGSFHPKVTDFKELCGS